MKALTFSRFGGSEVLEFTEVPDPDLNTGDILVQMKTIGLNYADIYRRKGNYQLKGKPPYIAGYEGAGIIVNANDAEGFKNGDLICFADVPFANAELVAVPASHAIPLPDDIDFETAASVLLQGLTAHYLTTDSHQVKEKEVVLIHAAAGGVGQLLTQMCKLKKAIDIGLTTSETKKPIILNIGADAVFNLRDDWKKDVLLFTNERGADVVYDSVGSTLMDSLDVTRTGGHVVFFGMSGGDAKPVDPRMLMDTSKTLTGGDLWNYLTSKEEFIKRAGKLFEWIRREKIKIAPPVVFKLSDGKAAHDFLESGKSAGKVLMVTID